MHARLSRKLDIGFCVGGFQVLGFAAWGSDVKGFRFEGLGWGFRSFGA